MAEGRRLGSRGEPVDGSKVQCPFPDCNSRVKCFVQHLNKIHKLEDRETAAELLEGFDLRRCFQCGFYSVAEHGLARHKCPNRTGPPVLGADAEEGSVSNGSEDRAEDDPGEGDPDGPMGGDELGGDGGDPNQLDAGFSTMKHPTLENIAGPLLVTFSDIASKILGLITDRDLDDTIRDRAERALYNLPEALKNVEYAAGGKSANRKKALRNVVIALNRSDDILGEIERLADRMQARLQRTQGRRLQRGVEIGWDQHVSTISASVRGGNLSAAHQYIKDLEAGIKDKVFQRTPAEVAELVAPFCPEATEDDHVIPFEERCVEDLEDGEERPEAFQLELEQVRAAFLSLKQGKAAGQSGWSNNLLKALALSESALPEFFTRITAWYNMMLCGEGRASEMWLLGRVALLEKADGGFRTLVLSDVLIRTWERAVAFALKEDFAEILWSTQMSVGVRGGSEIMALRLIVGWAD